MNALLYAPQYRPNLSSMIRTAEFFGLKKIYIYDENGLLNPPKNKAGRAEMAHMARVWTAGAIEFIEVKIIEDIQSFLTNYPGRKIATMLDPTAEHLTEFQFEKNDLILLGSEKTGIPPAVAASLDASVYLPQVGQTNCLNVAVTFGIVLHWAMQHKI